MCFPFKRHQELARHGEIKNNSKNKKLGCRKGWMLSRIVRIRFLQSGDLLYQLGTCDTALSPSQWPI